MGGREENVSSVDSDEVDSVVRVLMSYGESTTIEAEDDEETPEVIPGEEEEDSLADMYMPPNQVLSYG